MPRYFAFLRGINLGGHTVTNDQLVRLFAGAGVAGAEPFIASGNLSFVSRAAAPSLEKKLAVHLERELGYAVATFVRSHAELERIGALAPFPPARVRTAMVVNIGFLGSAPTAAQRATIAAFNDGESDFHVEGREVYWLCQVRQSESRFFRVPFEKRIGALCSWRNRNTIDRLLTKYRT